MGTPLMQPYRKDDLRRSKGLRIQEKERKKWDRKRAVGSDMSKNRAKNKRTERKRRLKIET